MPKPFELLASHGRAAVCFFFILSGFILAYTYRNRIRKGWVSEFIFARFARIYPMHIAALCFSIPVALYSIRHNQNFASWVNAATLTPANAIESWLASAALFQIYIPHPHFGFLWNSPCWSIACEATFYVSFPFFFNFILRTLKTWKTTLAAIFSCFVVQFLLIFISVYWVRHYSNGDERHVMEEIVYKLPFFRIWEFWMGCCIGLLFIDFRPRFLQVRLWRDFGLTIGFLLVALIVAATYLHVYGTFYGHWFVLYTLPFSVIILCLASGPTYLSKSLGSPLAVLLGDASYSFYLLHFLFILLLGCFYHNRNTPFVVIIETFIVCSCTSIICFKYIETPARLWIKTLGRSRKDEPQRELNDSVSESKRSQSQFG